MEEKKVLSIDTMICDLRTVSEETLQSYDKIYISAMTVFITERTQELFHRYPVDLDAMAVEKLDENVRLVEQNGVYKITDQEQAGEPILPDGKRTAADRKGCRKSTGKLRENCCKR